MPFQPVESTFLFDTSLKFWYIYFKPTFNFSRSKIMNNFDRVNNSGINSEDMQLIKSYDAQIILDNDDKTLMQIRMKDFTVSVIKWKDSFYSEKPYEMAGLSGNGQLLPLYGVSDDVVHLKNLGEVKIILENIKDGKSINDKSWLEGIDRYTIKQMRLRKNVLPR